MEILVRFSKCEAEDENEPKLCVECFASSYGTRGKESKAEEARFASKGGTGGRTESKAFNFTSLQPPAGITTTDFRHTQNIVIRMDLQMSPGKMCAQACHAAIMASEEARRHYWRWWIQWLKEGQRKVALKARSLEELMALKDEAEKLGIPIGLVQDMGYTELPPGTVTCLGLGPAPTKLVDKVTGSLPLL